MDDAVIFILTILQSASMSSYNSPTKVALRVSRSSISPDTFEYYKEPKSRKELHSLLPEHIQALGNVVDVEVDYLYDIVDLTKKEAVK